MAHQLQGSVWGRHLRHMLALLRLGFGVLGHRLDLLLVLLEVSMDLAGHSLVDYG